MFAARPEDALSAYRHVLVVDDHAIVRAGIAQLLAQLLPAAQVLQAGTRVQALARLREQPDIGLVTLDLALPDGERLGTLREIRRDFPTVPLVVLSALEDPLLAAQALQLGALGYIPKSSDAALVHDALGVVLAGGCYVPRFVLAAQRSRAQTAAPAQTLTERQRQVLALLAEGLPNKEIARTLGLAETTVKTHLATVFRVLKARNRSQALLLAREHLLGGPLTP